MSLSEEFLVSNSRDKVIHNRIDNLQKTVSEQSKIIGELYVKVAKLVFLLRKKLDVKMEECELGDEYIQGKNNPEPQRV